MHQNKTRDWLMALAAAVVVLLLLCTPSLAASGAEMTGASLSLETEMNAAVWDGPLFDLLVGLAIGASAAALIRLYQRLATPRRTAG